MLDQLLAYVKAANRMCPRAQQWNRLWKMLPARGRKEGGWEPPLPLILGAWWETSEAEKQEALRDQITWAAEHGAIEEVDRFLRDLPEEEWEHTTSSTLSQLEAVLRPEPSTEQD